MCGNWVRRGSCRAVLVQELRPRCRVFNGWVCDYCFDMLEAWEETHDIKLEIRTLDLFTRLPDNLKELTLVGTGGGGGSGLSTKRESKTTHRSVARGMAQP